MVLYCNYNNKVNDTQCEIVEDIIITYVRTSGPKANMFIFMLRNN